MSNSKTQRHRLLAKIHIAQKELCMDDETYRAMLWTVSRVKSAGRLDEAGLQKILDHMMSLGFRVKRSAVLYPGRPGNTDREPQLRKIEALLTNMRLPWAYADAIAHQMYGIKKVGWLHEDQRRAVITALVKEKRGR